MAKTTMIGTFKMAGELSNVNMAVRMACSIIHEAEQAGRPISRGDLINRVTREYCLSDANYSWLGSPGPRSPIGTLWDREKGPDGKYVMRMLPQGMQFVGTHLGRDEFEAAKRHHLWESRGVYDVIKPGELYKVRVLGGDMIPCTVIGEGLYGFTVLGAPDGDMRFSPHQFHTFECDGGCNGSDLSPNAFTSQCLGAKKKKVA